MNRKRLSARRARSAWRRANGIRLPAPPGSGRAFPVFTQVPCGSLTPLEKRLIDHVSHGQWLDLAGDEAVDEDAMRSWGVSRTCRATVIRDILRGRLVANPDPHGLRLRGARISGRLDLENLSTEVNLELTDCRLWEGILARDARLPAVGLIGCSLKHPAKPPLDAQRLTCGAFNMTGAKIIGNTAFGAVNMTAAHIGGVLHFDEARLHNKSGPALFADGLQVDQDMFFRGGFSATGDGKLGAVRLVGAHIGGELQWNQANLSDKSGPALFAQSLQVDQGMFLVDGFTAEGGGDGVAVDLTDAKVGGSLAFDYDSKKLRDVTDPQPRLTNLTHVTDPQRRLTVNGMTYPGVPERVTAGDWLLLLREGTPRYAAQPYQQLAAGYRARGDDQQVRKILIAQRDHQLTRTPPDLPKWLGGKISRNTPTHPSLWEWLWGKVTKVTLGYGYKPWLALVWLAGVAALSVVLALGLGSSGALAQTDKTATPGRPCSAVQQISVGLDLNLPVGTSLARAKCDLTMDSASVTADWLAGVGWFLRLLAWAFAALFIAGFTSAVRKT